MPVRKLSSALASHVHASTVSGKDFSKRTNVWKFKANDGKEWKFLAESTEEVESKTFKGNGVVKKLKLKGPSAKEVADCKTSKQDGVQKNEGNGPVKKLRLKGPSSKEEAKCKTSKQNGVQKKVESIEAQVLRNISVQDGVLKKRRPSSQCHEDASESKTLKQDGSQKKLKLNSLSTEKEAKRETTKQDGMLKKLNSNNPCLVSNLFFFFFFFYSL